MRSISSCLVGLMVTCAAVAGISGTARADGPDTPSLTSVRPVIGHGIHRFTTAVVHSQQPTSTGMVQRSTDLVELYGDLEGRILYHPTSVFDFAAGTLVNTGHQVFSGTVLGGGPVLLFDDRFRFEVDLETGATVGKVYLTRTLAGGPTRCELDVVGTGQTPEGDATIEYTGECRLSGR
jgi:hypothetical protein